MAMDEYLPMFLAECRESLQSLNVAIVALEERPEDAGVLDEIFRIAHSLKGMSATMGFAEMAHITHEMEDVFELLRDRTEPLEPAAIDVLLACLDALEACVDSIEATGAESLEPAVLIGKLRTLIRKEDGPADGLVVVSAEPAPRPVALADGERLAELVVTLGSEAMMPSVRALMLLRACEDHGRVVRSDPEEAALEGFSGDRVSVTLVLTGETADLEAAARQIQDVETVTVEVQGAEPTAVGDPAPRAAAPGRLEALEPPPERRNRAAATVRVDAERLDQLMHCMGELVVQRTHVEELAAQADIPGLAHAVQELTRSSHQLQAMVMQIRMIPVEAVFARFPRLIRDASSKLGKRVDLQIIGQETELDRTVVDALGDPMVHLIRNALDHGLESPEERRAAGKPEEGVLEIAARHAGGSIVISVRDDGRGVDPTKVGPRALERGLITAEQAQALDVAGAVELLFAPGFSTVETVGDLSGRGVGMDAVRDRIRRLGGEAVMTSVPGQGTLAEIRLPLTLAIMSALLVEADGRPYGVPLNRVLRTLRLADQVERSVGGRRMLVLEDGAVPIRSASDAFDHPVPESPDTHVVLVQSGERRIALSVSRLIGQRELVTRPLPAAALANRALSGAAVLPSGDIVLLADCDALFDGVQLDTRTVSAPIQKAAL